MCHFSRTWSKLLSTADHSLAREYGCSVCWMVGEMVNLASGVEEVFVKTAQVGVTCDIPVSYNLFPYIAVHITTSPRPNCQHFRSDGIQTQASLGHDLPTFSVWFKFSLNIFTILLL